MKKQLLTLFAGTMMLANVNAQTSGKEAGNSTNKEIAAERKDGLQHYKDAYASLTGEIGNSEVSKEELLKNKELRGFYGTGKKGTYLPCIVVSFEIEMNIETTIEGKIQKLPPFKSASNKITEEQTDILKQLHSGSKVIIQNIIIKAPDEKKYVIDPVVLTIK